MVMSDANWDLPGCTGGTAWRASASQGEVTAATGVWHQEEAPPCTAWPPSLHWLLTLSVGSETAS